MADYDWFTRPLADGYEATIKVRFRKRPQMWGPEINPDVVAYLIYDELKDNGRLRDAVDTIVGVKVSLFEKAKV
jgi:hypothetical protein